MEAHINRIMNKADSTLGFLRRNLKACPPKLFLPGQIILRIIFSSLGPLQTKNIDQLEKMQRSAARFVTQNYRQTASVTSLIQNLGWTENEKV